MEKRHGNYYLQRPERTSSWLIEIRQYYSMVAPLEETREGGEKKKEKKKDAAGPLQSMKKKSGYITCSDLSSLSYRQSGELNRQVGNHASEGVAGNRRDL